MNLVIVGTGEEDNQAPNESQILNFPVWLIVGGGHMNYSGPIRCKGKSALVSENVFAFLMKGTDRRGELTYCLLLPLNLSVTPGVWLSSCDQEAASMRRES